MRAAILILLTLSMTAQAEAVVGDADLGDSNYINAWPGLRTMASGPNRDQFLGGMNQSYGDVVKKFKEQNIQRPITLEDVAKEYSTHSDYPRTALLGTCAVIIGGTVAAIAGAHAYIRANHPKILQIIKGMPGGCDEAKLIDSINGKSRSPTPAGDAVG